MRIQFLKRIISIFLSCCIIGSALPVKIYAKEAVDAGWTRQKYEYRDAEYMYDSSVNMEYVTMLGMEYEACQERINSYIRQSALDDMFQSLLFSVRETYYEENELGEVRTDVGINHIDYFGPCYLYGDILSISHSCTDMTLGLFSEFGTWEASKNHYFLEIDNLNLKTNKLVKLNDFFVINEELWEILEGVDVTLYKI